MFKKHISGKTVNGRRWNDRKKSSSRENGPPEKKKQGDERIHQVPPQLPTRSRGINLSSDPCLRNTFPADCCGLMPIPSFVIMALVAGGTLNSSAANLSTAVKGVASGTLRTLKGSLGSEVRVILKVTLEPGAA